MNKVIIFTAVISFLGGTEGISETTEDKGHRIVVEAEDSGSGFNDYSADGRMVLKEKGSSEAERSLSLKVLEGNEGTGDKTLMVFKTPRDIKGTSLLTWASKRGKDDQWLYLPTLKRVKRISSSNKSGSFLGSEFSFEDLTPREVGKYKYKYLSLKKCSMGECHVVESYPKDRKSAYKRQKVYIDTKEKRIVKVVFYDRKNSLLKTMSMSGFRRYKKKFWAASKVVMKNHQNKKVTIFNWANYKYQKGLQKRMFNKSYLKRAK